MKFTGGCHCGNIEIEFTTDIPPSEIEIRACQCSFCRKHNSRTVSDPRGQVCIRLEDPARVSFYEFGLRTAAYLVCATCGVYVAALTRQEPRRVIVVLNSLRDHEMFSQPVLPVEYDDESRKARLARRQSTWTPAAIIGSDR